MPTPKRAAVASGPQRAEHRSASGHSFGQLEQRQPCREWAGTTAGTGARVQEGAAAPAADAEEWVQGGTGEADDKLGPKLQS
eukprot:1161201-Pelagomonas_calceolata.AAC.15